MMTNLAVPTPRISFHHRYPHLTEPQLEIADESLRQYVALAVRVVERTRIDAEAWVPFKTFDSVAGRS